jgi:hypothetical protein
MIGLLRNIHIGLRMAWALAITSGLLLASLTVMWLRMSTSTAMQSATLEELEMKRTELADQINRKWSEISDVTTTAQMERRSVQAGFIKPDKVEYLVMQPISQTETNK